MGEHRRGAVWSVQRPSLLTPDLPIGSLPCWNILCFCVFIFQPPTFTTTKALTSNKFIHSSQTCMIYTSEVNIKAKSVEFKKGKIWFWVLSVENNETPSSCVAWRLFFSFSPKRNRQPGPSACFHLSQVQPVPRGPAEPWGLKRGFSHPQKPSSCCPSIFSLSMQPLSLLYVQGTLCEPTLSHLRGTACAGLGMGTLALAGAVLLSSWHLWGGSPWTCSC